MIGERVKRARLAAGLSMDSLGKVAGVSANMIKKYEHDQSMPSSGVLIRLADALNVRSEYFFRPARVELADIEYRKRASLPQKVLNRIKADILDQAERWMELQQLWPNYPVPGFEIPVDLPAVTDLESVDPVADAVRERWQLGFNPLPELISLLESKGVLVIMTDELQAERFDGLQARLNHQPIVAISSGWPGDRQRFTLAHELGHLLLHGRLPDSLDEEQVCNRFAGALLLPAVAAVERMGAVRHHLEWKELELLKQEYGISMAAILYRCRHLGIITESRHKQMMIEFSANDWRKREPGEAVAAETTQLFAQLVYRGLGEGILSSSKAAELLNQPLAEFRQARKMQEVAV